MLLDNKAIAFISASTMLTNSEVVLCVNNSLVHHVWPTWSHDPLSLVLIIPGVQITFLV